MSTITTTGLIRASLDALGTTAEAVARTLRAEGVTGYRKSQYCCPVANFLNSRMELAGIEVTEREVIADLPDGSSVTVIPPLPVARFIDRFDGGAFPSLAHHPEGDRRARHAA